MTDIRKEINNAWDYTKQAKELATAAIESFEANGHADIYDIYDILSDEAADFFVYYADAHDYLNDANQHDLAPAETYSITDAAVFFLYEEATDLLCAAGFFSEEEEAEDLSTEIKRAAEDIAEKLSEDPELNADLIEALRSYK